MDVALQTLNPTACKNVIILTLIKTHKNYLAFAAVSLGNGKYAVGFSKVIQSLNPNPVGGGLKMAKKGVFRAFLLSAVLIFGSWNSFF